MPITANNPDRKTWLEVPENSDFPIQNIPFGCFKNKKKIKCVGTRIGNHAINLNALHNLNYFENIPLPKNVFLGNLNAFLKLEKVIWRKVRDRIADIFDVKNQSNKIQTDLFLSPINQVDMCMPVQIGDYTVVAPFEADEETESEQVDTSETKDVPTGVEVC